MEDTMPRPPKLDPEKALADALAEVVRLFPPEDIRLVAQETGFIQRLRKIDPVVFFWNLILGFSCSAQRTLDALRRQFQTIADVDLVPSSFLDRFSPNLVRFLKTLLERAWKSFCQTSPLTGPLAQFADISIFDGTIVTLFKSLSRIFPGVKSPAAAKITVVMSVRNYNAKSIHIFPGSKADTETVRLGPWVKNHLLLFDLGYFKYQIFARILKNGGSFVSRLKKGANPLIVKVHKTYRGNAISMEGKRLQDVLPALKRQEIDVEVEVSFKHRIYAGEERKDTLQFRLVGRMNAETREYHLYLTNLPENAFSPEQISRLYRGRWFIELLFKELKSRYALDVIKTSKVEVVEALIYAGLLTLTVSKAMFQMYQKAMIRSHRRMTPLRWAAIFYEQVPRLMIRILKKSGVEVSLGDLLAQSMLEAEDPTPDRERLEDVWDL